MASKVFCGIYVIRNLVNGHRYVGSSVNITSRWTVHRCYLRKGTCACTLLQHAWNKYGETEFQFEIIDECSRDQLGIKEQYWMGLLNPEYNICEATYLDGRLGGNRTGLTNSPEHCERISQTRKGQPGSKGHTGYTHTEETKKVIAEKAKINSTGRKMSEEAREKMRVAATGRKMSPEAIEKMRAAKLGSKASTETKAKMSASQKISHANPETQKKRSEATTGRVFSEETKQKISDAHKGKPKSIEAIEKMKATKRAQKQNKK